MIQTTQKLSSTASQLNYNLNHSSLIKKGCTHRELPIANQKILFQSYMEGTLSGAKEQEKSALMTKPGVIV